MTSSFHVPCSIQRKRDSSFITLQQTRTLHLPNNCLFQFLLKRERLSLHSQMMQRVQVLLHLSCCPVFFCIECILLKNIIKAEISFTFVWSWDYSYWILHCFIALGYVTTVLTSNSFIAFHSSIGTHSSRFTTCLTQCINRN